MSNGRLRESALVADCGSATTRVVLLDIAQGQYRFIASGQAPSTGEPPWSDITIGLLDAIRQIEAVTERQLISPEGNLIVQAKDARVGVDLFVAATSAAPSLKTILVGLTDDISLASARRVVLSTYATIEDEFSLADTRSEESQSERLAELEPDVVLITGGSDGGASKRVLQLTETVLVGLALMEPSARPTTVLYAGNATLRPKVVELLEGTAVRSTDNVRPQPDVEYLGPARSEMATLFEEHRLLDLPGANDLRGIADGALVPSAKAFNWTVQYLAQVLHRNVIGVDVGSASVTLSTVIDDAPQMVIKSDLGIGHNLPRLLQHCSPQQILSWYPKELNHRALYAFVENCALFPRTAPMSTDDSLLELALARELIRATLPAAFPTRFNGTAAGQLPPVELILASGAVLSNTTRPGQSAPGFAGRPATGRNLHPGAGHPGAGNHPRGSGYRAADDGRPGSRSRRISRVGQRDRARR